MLVFGFNLKLVLKMTKEEDVREKIMHKYLQNPNSSYNSNTTNGVWMYLQNRCKYIHTPLVVLFNVFLKQNRSNANLVVEERKVLKI